MFVNADFSRTASVSADQYNWVASPQGGVERVILDRIGEEKARATSIVRYAPGASFPTHEHPGGEEVLVLSGTFSEDGRDYPAGFYLRNPPGSSHQPYSNEGTTIFVKLWQMQASEKDRVCIDTRDKALWQSRDGRDTCPLFSNENETVFLQRVPAGERLLPETLAGVELLVLAGDVSMNNQIYASGSWIRLPAGAKTDITTGPKGAELYIKSGHLADTGWSDPVE